MTNAVEAECERCGRMRLAICMGPFEGGWARICPACKVYLLINGARGREPGRDLTVGGVVIATGDFDDPRGDLN